VETRVDKRRQEETTGTIQEERRQEETRGEEMRGDETRQEELRVLNIDATRV
jgi:hypothetical protein